MLYLLLGIIPEVFMFYFYVINIKKLKDKKFICFVGFLAVYIISKFIFRYSVYFNLACIFGFYIILKILYKDKAKITDIFLMSFVSLMLILTSIFTYFVIKDYWISLCFNRIFVILEILFSFFDTDIYQKYMNCWNRNKQNPNKIKSLTLRNISIITFNFMVFIINLLLQAVIYNSAC